MMNAIRLKLMFPRVLDYRILLYPLFLNSFAMDAILLRKYSLFIIFFIKNIWFNNDLKTVNPKKS